MRRFIQGVFFLMVFNWRFVIPFVRAHMFREELFRAPANQLAQVKIYQMKDTLVLMEVAHPTKNLNEEADSQIEA